MNFNSITLIITSALCAFGFGFFLNYLKYKSITAVLKEKISAIENQSELFQKEIKSQSQIHEKLRADKEQLTINLTTLQTKHQYLKEEFEKRKSIANLTKSIWTTVVRI